MMTSDTPLPSTPDSAPRKRWRDRLFVVGLAALFLLGLAGVIAATGWRETMQQIARLHLWQIGLLLLLSLANYLMRGLRWHLFAQRLGMPTRLGQDIRHFLGGFAMSVTPGRVGELVRMRWLRRETGWAYERTAPMVLVDRAADLVAMALILGVALTQATTGIRGALPVTVLALAAAFMATRPRLLAWIAHMGYRTTGRLPRLFARVRRAALSLERFSHGPTLMLALVLGLMGWFAEGYAFHLLLAWMGADPGLWTAIAIFVFATLAGGLTGAPGGVGGAEAAMIALLTLAGIPLAVSVPATAIIRVTTLWFAIGIGMAVFPLAERKSLKGHHALESR